MPKIRAAVLHGVNDLRVHDWDLPEEVPEGHVRIAIKKVGICQSDVHFWYEWLKCSDVLGRLY